ncbi:MAG: porin family protein [Rhodocyclaceae bacterium]
MAHTPPSHFLGGLLLASLLASPALAAPESITPSATESAPASAAAIRSEAVRLLEQNRPDAAYRLLQPLHAGDEGDIDTTFLLGQAALLSQRPAEAVTLFQAILARNPNLPRVRLELGRAYAALGEAEKARNEFHTVLAANPPHAVGDNIRAFIESMPSEKRWSLRLSGGYLYDSNVSAGPTNGSVLMFGLPFLLSREALKRSDSGYTFSLGASHQLPLDGSLALQTDLQYSRTDYTTLDEFNADIFSISSGPTWRLGGNIFSLPLLFENILIGQSRFSTAVGIAPQVLLPVTDRLFINAAMTGQAKDYHVSDGVRDGTLWSASTGARYYLGQNAFLQATYRHGEEKTRLDFLDNHSNGVSLAFHASLPAGFSFYLAPGVTRTRYAAQEAAFDSRRRDTLYTLTANLAKEFGKSGISVALGYSYSDNDSNLSLYEYKRNQITAQISSTF